MLPPTHPDQPEEAIPPFPTAIPEDADDVIPADEVLPPARAPAGTPHPPLPRVILGCATFGYGVYAARESVRSSLPVRVVRAALRAGVTAFDTAPHYHPSEIILGNALAALPEFPRESYAIITKCAKYGARVDEHVYDPAVVRRSVERSLRRLQTDYLDVVYLHDVEFVASKPFPSPAGFHLEALDKPAQSAAWGLDDAARSHGAGDDSILACFAALRALQAEGKIRRVGLAGYPLPVLVRLSHLILARTGAPVDIVQTYAHHTLACADLTGFLPAFAAAKVGQVVNAAPLAMGLLTAGGGPEWHPAKQVPELRDAAADAVGVAREKGSSIEAAACAFGYREIEYAGAPVPVVVGCTDLAQLHQTLRAYRGVNAGEGETREAEEAVIRLFEERGVRHYSWQSPMPQAF